MRGGRGARRTEVSTDLLIGEAINAGRASFQLTVQQNPGLLGGVAFYQDSRSIRERTR